MANNSCWYQLSVEDVLKMLKTNSIGLTSSEAMNRLAKHGPNELKSRKPSILMRFLRQFNGPRGIAISQFGEVYVADYNNNRIQKFTSSG